jgi:nicotinamidase-related amidase
MSGPELTNGPPGPNSVHLCVDMQRLFAEHTDWHTPWMVRVLPVVRRLVAREPARTVFTRFMPLTNAGEGIGTWNRYYQRWDSMTLEHLGEGMADLVPELASFVPPAAAVDKKTYSPWITPALHEMLRARGTDTLLVSGGETDVCVLGTVLGAVDLGYRVILVSDALCSSSDETHDSMLGLYNRRYGQQVEVATADTVLAAWP